jgi:glycogen operon protein
MLLHGDEIGRSQRGNNNPYCQDNPIAWLDWDLDSEAQHFLEFTRRVFALRTASPLVRRTRFFTGEIDPEFGERDVAWLRADGQEMQPSDWQADDARVLGMLIPREPNPEEDAEGHPVPAETLLLIFNASARARRFRLPARAHPGVWQHTLCSAGSVERRLRGAKVRVPAHSVSLLSYREPR